MMVCVNILKKVILTHSLGNVLTCSAIEDHNLQVDKYFMLNAAVPSEAFDGGLANTSTNGNYLVHEDWGQYYFGQTNDFLFASEWYTLFNNNDARHDLSWRGIFTNMNNTTVYNMYSGGEDVLENLEHDEGDFTDITAAWGCQEKLKGRMPLDYLVGSTKGGWGLNEDYNYATTNQGHVIWYHMDPQDAQNISPTNLITEPFFLKTPAELFNTNQVAAENYASVSNKYILAKAIPARSFATGANAVSGNTVNNNINMNISCQNGWPRDADEEGERPKWFHSDIKNIGYLYNYQAYNYIVDEGELDDE